MNNKSNRQNLKVAAVDFIPAWGDLEGNISRLVEAVEKTAEQGIDYCVFPETAVSGYLFSDPIEIKPFLDTVPGKTTSAISPILKRNNMYMSIGIAELDIETGLPYNTAVLMGPQGIIGKYRKIGLNSQDQKVFAPGNTGIKTFDTPIGKISLLICYDDTYWQYARLAALDGAQIIGWHSVSDRIMPNSNKSEMLGDHSTIAHVQHMSALNGAWVICATRSGIETNPNNHMQLYYNGGSSIWSPDGTKIEQAPVVSPIEIKPRLNGIYSTFINVDEADKHRKFLLAKRRPELYSPFLAFHRCPTDSAATQERKKVKLRALQHDNNTILDLSTIEVNENELLVLPELCSLPCTNNLDIVKEYAEKKGGNFEQSLIKIATKGKGFVVGSYPEIDNNKIYHTIVLAGPNSDILARYSVTHLSAWEKSWATAGEAITIASTQIGRIALAASHELIVPELGGVYATLRADILAAPAGMPNKLKVEIDSHLYSVNNPPTGKADFYPYVAACLNQLWIVCGGYKNENFSSAAIYGPEPIILTPTLVAELDEPSVTLLAKVPAMYTWINQERLINGQQALWYIPLTQ